MGCPKNPKKLWILSWNGAHGSVDTRVERFGSYSWGEYKVQKKCPKCKVSHGYAIRDEVTMQKRGYDVEKLQKLSGGLMCSKDAIDLK